MIVSLIFVSNNIYCKSFKRKIPVSLYINKDIRDLSMLNIVGKQDNETLVLSTASGLQIY